MPTCDKLLWLDVDCTVLRRLKFMPLTSFSLCLVSSEPPSYTIFRVFNSPVTSATSCMFTLKESRLILCSTNGDCKLGPVRCKYVSDATASWRLEVGGRRCGIYLLEYSEFGDSCHSVRRKPVLSLQCFTTGQHVVSGADAEKRLDE